MMREAQQGCTSTEHHAWGLNGAMASLFSTLLMAVTPPSKEMRLPALRCAPKSAGCKLHALQRDLKTPQSLRSGTLQACNCSIPG